MNWFQSFWKSLTGAATDPTRVHLHVQLEGKSLPADEHIGTFTPRAQQVLALARLEADRFNHNVIGTEHLLLGLIVLGQGVAVNVLRKMGLDLETVRAEVKKRVGTGPDKEVSGDIPYAPRVKKVLALASKQAKALNHTYVGTEHILLGILQEGDGVAAQILRNLNVDLEQTRREILKELDPNLQLARGVPGTAPSTTTVASPNSTSVRAASAQPSGEPVDINRRYDVYCTEGKQGVMIYRNARFRGSKHLLPKSQHDTISTFVELEQSDGQIVYVARTSIIKFCEPGATAGPDSDSSQKP